MEYGDVENTVYMKCSVDCVIFNVHVGKFFFSIAVEKNRWKNICNEAIKMRKNKKK